MDDYKELLERLRFGNTDSETMNGAANAIESLLAENERLKHNLATTEQIEQETAEAIAKLISDHYGYDSDGALMVRSGAWKEFKK